jgi:crossover junction endodeoxyribonuclease RuvC
VTTTESKIILGIDPGSVIMGYGLIATKGASFSFLEMGVLRIGEAGDHFSRLSEVFFNITRLVRTYNVEEMAIEAPFFGKNVQSMLKLGRVQGVCIAAAMSLNVEVKEYAPRSVKQAITGRGAASKEQVYGMLAHMVKDLNTQLPLDASDALAVALCHHFQTHRPELNKKVSITQKNKNPAAKWAKFIKDNPGRASE